MNTVSRGHLKFKGGGRWEKLSVTVFEMTISMGGEGGDDDR